MMDIDVSRDDAPDLRLILVGSQRFGVNAVANSILGRESMKASEWGRRTARSVTHTSLVQGRRIQLVKAPVWLRSYYLCDTARLVEEELVLSVTHCPPGPHAFILLVEVDVPFTGACSNAVKAHLNLFGEDVWSHAVVLFTCGDWLGNTSIEEYIEGEGADLAELLDRCGRRYVFDSTGASTALSRRLLEKVEELLRRNGGRHFQIDGNEIEKILQRKEEVNRRAELRRQKRKEQRNKERDKADSVSEITIILLGWVFAVKSKVRCALLGIPEHVGRTKQCITTSTVLRNELKLTVVDTPGWWKYFSARLVPSHTRAEIDTAFRVYRDVSDAASGRAVFLMIPADTSFTFEQLKIIRDNMKPLGESVWQNTILVFTRGHWLGQFEIEHHIESEGEALVWLVEKCGNRYFVFDGDAEQSGLEAQGKQLIDMVLDLCQAPNEKITATEPLLEEESVEEPVDEDLRKMVNVLHNVWAWGSWEIEEFAARFFERPMYEFTDIASMHLTNLFKGSSDLRLIKQTREEVEKILREELQGKSLEELVEIALQIYFRKEVGAFDIVSIICEKDQFKPEWKMLFEREWARREVRLMEYVFQRYVKAGSDDARRLMESYNRVSAWLEAMPPSVEELVRMISNKLKSVVVNSTLEAEGSGVIGSSSQQTVF